MSKVDAWAGVSRGSCEGIEKIVPGGVQTTDGREIEVDMLVCATGFDTSYRPKFLLIGTEGRSLAREWTANIPEAYIGVAVPGYPNYFSTTGSVGRL